MCPRLFKIDHYSKKDKRQLVRMLQMGKGVVPEKNLFVRFGIFQHTGAVCNLHLRLRHHKCGNLEWTGLKDAVAFNFSTWFGSIVGLKDPDAGSGSDDKKKYWK